VVADATAPLALDGRLRGRLVMTYQNEHHFYEIAKDSKEVLYGIAEFDATPTTLLTAGINYTHQDSLPWVEGLPRYIDGGDLKLPRSTALIFPWNRSNFDTTEYFGELEQKIA
jgi:outer membrane receptor for ferric coprogen and ferric-rhodotorulic acid